MSKPTQKDNSTFHQKALLRQMALARLEAEPVVMETHGGAGKLYDACYRDVGRDVVFEKDPDKAAILGRQRPAWAVYEGDCVTAIEGGAGAHLEVNLLDVDPYGDPWPVIGAFFESERPRAGRLMVAVNDGLRQKLVIGAWDVGTMQGMVAKYGNKLAPIYLEVCRELMAEKAAQAGYDLDRWAGYYCGSGKRMTHYLAILTRNGPGRA